VHDRREVLETLGRVVAEAWTSFEHPRPVEPTLDQALTERLLEPLPEEPDDAQRAIADVAEALDASISPARPLYLAYIGSTGLDMGVLGAALAATYDVNLAVVAGGADLIERQALAWTAQFIGYPHAEGSFTSGGMTSNLTALLAARERALPGCRIEGLNGRRGAVYCSIETHHSVTRAVETTGLGRASIRSLPLDERRRMRPDDLDAAIAADRGDGVTPVAVVANGGTTLTGAVDDLAAIAEVCERHGVWLHVDGAYGVAAAGVPSRAPLFEGLERADSVVLDAHKWLGVPKACSVVLVRDASTLEAAFGHQERYMLHQDGTPNAVDRTVEYSRPVRSLKLWLAFRVYGAGAFRSWIEETLRLAERFRDLVESDSAFELLHEPTLSTVCFRHLPEDGRDPDEHNRRLAIAAQQDGRVYIAPAVVDDRICLRACFVNFHTREEDADAVLGVLRELGDVQRRTPKTVV
jgi:aromatic-L-amino-acid/L-tryptophan decarboxylase